MYKSKRGPYPPFHVSLASIPAWLSLLFCRRRELLGLKVLYVFTKLQGSASHKTGFSTVSRDFSQSIHYCYLRPSLLSLLSYSMTMDMCNFLGCTGSVNIVHASINKMSKDMALDTGFTAMYTGFALMLVTTYTANLSVWLMGKNFVNTCWNTCLLQFVTLFINTGECRYVFVFIRR